MPDLNTRFTRVAVFGGVYSNYLALEAVLADARAAGAEAIFCLGDIGAFGPHPDRAVDILRASDVHTLQGNYDDSVGNALDDCQCGYTDPRDNHYAQLSYDYTLGNTRADNRAWLRALPAGFRCRLGDARVLMSHGSPRRVNEFLWQSTTPEPFIRRLLGEHDADLILCTHTGLPWRRFTGDAPGRRGLVNVGAIGRPANDGDPRISYDLIDARGGTIEVQTRKVTYDHHRLAAEMRAESLPEEFVETILTGWWTTCLEILPIRERTSGLH